MSSITDKKNPHWERIFDMWEWCHPHWGLVRKVRASHKFKYDFFGIPEESNVIQKLGPFLKLQEAKEACEAWHKQVQVG